MRAFSTSGFYTRAVQVKYPTGPHKATHLGRELLTFRAQICPLKYHATCCRLSFFNMHVYRCDISTPESILTKERKKTATY